MIGFEDQLARQAGPLLYQVIQAYLTRQFPGQGISIHDLKPGADIDQAHHWLTGIDRPAQQTEYTAIQLEHGLSGCRMESRLPAAKFARISRSVIVNIERIKELQPLFHGEYSVILHQGTQLTLSRRYRDKLPQLGLE